VTLGVLLLWPALAAAEDKVYRIEIYQGPYRTVHYVSTNPDEGAAMRERARYENEGALADEVAELKRQYVRGEHLLDAGRRPVQAAYYGVSVDSSAYASLGYGYGYNPGFGYTYAGYYPFGGGYGYNGVVGGSTNVSRGLEHGVGDEGPIKRDLARVIAGESGLGTPARAYASTEGPVKRVRNETARQATLTLKDGKEVKGLIQPSPEADWIVLRDGKADVWVLRSEVVRMRIEDAQGVKPAVDK
jgi:hypothetical protein